MDILENNDVVRNEIGAMMDSMLTQTFNRKLAAWRAQNAFVQLTPLPNAVVTLVLAAGVPKEVNLPSGTRVIRMRGNSDYYVTDNGNAVVPTVDSIDGSGMVYRPDGVLYFCEEAKSFSVCSVGACIVSVECFIQQ